MRKLFFVSLFFKDSKSKKISLTSVNIFWNERKFKVKLLDNNAKQEQIEGNTNKTNDSNKL